MTESDLAKIKFRMVSHLNMGTQPACAYESIDHEPKIEMCVHTLVRDDDTMGYSFAHYCFNGKTYKTKKKLQKISGKAHDFSRGMKAPQCFF